ncbi:hypothetical protein ScPMuIL_015483, partial [Solemya velum]
MNNIGLTRDVFLGCMSAIYLFAFTSLYVQIPGLYGDHGILPAKLVLDKEAESWDELMEGQPTLLKLTPKLGLDIQTGMDLLCLSGIIISFMSLVFKGARDVVSFTLLWMLYLSLYQVGQTFLWFQWDILLLEAGFLTILVAPFSLQLPFRRWKMSRYHQHDTITLWLVKWLLFRLMFASGVVKLNSKCPTWWGLTALNWHFESQCIPNPLAWYWHHFPEWFLKLSTVMTFVIEIPIPFLFFSPVRSLRVFSFWAQILLQVAIILTGNYNFFNWLTIVLCIPLLDDDFFRKKRNLKAKKSRIGMLIESIAAIAVYSYLAFQTYKFFSLKINSDYSVHSEIAFSEKKYFKWLEMVTPWTIWIGGISLGYEILLAIMRSLLKEKGVFSKASSTIQCLLFGALAAGMFSISLVPHTVIDGKAHRNIPAEIRAWHGRTDPFQITNSYGLFRVMTGVGGRPELIIEGSHNRDKGWKPYEFLYKPGSVDRRPPIVAPHQPRLDWQMWFAALGSYQHNPWVLNLVYRLLNGEKDVLELIDHNPFPGNPPKYMRATLYHYHYTSNNESSQRYSKQDWWVREEKANYIPVLSLEEPTFKQYLEHIKLLD